MKISRNLSGRIGWVLDNLLPPALRDAGWFMRPAMRLLFGDKAGLFMTFKEQAPLMSGAELLRRYEETADVHLDRETDLTPVVVDRILGDLLGDSVLDIACGKGYLARAIAGRTGRRVTAMDFNLPEGDPHPLVTFVRGSIERLDFADRAFDTVVSTHTLEHVVDLPAAVAELRRVARRRLIVVVPCQRNYRYTFDLHLHFFRYPHDLMLVMRNPCGRVCRLGDDLYYCEDVE